MAREAPDRGLEIDGAARELDGRHGALAAENRVYPLGKGRFGERLDQIVVRARIQAQPPVTDAVLGGEHQDGGALALLTPQLDQICPGVTGRSVSRATASNDRV